MKLIDCSAADATSHLFFAYLRSLTPDSVQGTNGISALPLSLQSLLETTEYPPTQHTFVESQTTKVVMIVDNVSPTPFALLRRAKHFQYRDDDRALQQFSEYEDPIQALTDECRRVLKNLSSANDSSTSKASTSLRDASWSRFEDMGFGGLGDDSDREDEVDGSALGRRRQRPLGLSTTAHSKVDLGRPTTPSWADFLSSGFVDDPSQKPPQHLLPPDKVLPPINTRSQSSQSQKRMTDDDSLLEPGELASIATFNLDDAFWWVWISSLAGEEPVERKAVFGRCALVETNIRGGRWLLMEEIIKAAAPELEDGAYIAEKKTRFGFSKRSRLNRNKSTTGKASMKQRKPEPTTRDRFPPVKKSNIAPDQHARIQAAAAALQQKHHLQDSVPISPRRGRHEDTVSTKTNSVFTLQPVILTEAAPAMKWANSYDKDAIRARYLGDNFAGKGSAVNLSAQADGVSNLVESTNGSTTPMATAKSHLPTQDRSQSYGFPQNDQNVTVVAAKREIEKDRDLPTLPSAQPQQDMQPQPSQDTRREPLQELRQQPQQEPQQPKLVSSPPEQVYIAPGGQASVLQKEYGGRSAVSSQQYQQQAYQSGRPSGLVDRQQIPSQTGQTYQQTRKPIGQAEQRKVPLQSPIALPATPVIDLKAANEAVTEAAKVPLPATTPTEYPRPMAVDRKPLPPTKEIEEQDPVRDPETFSPGPEYTEPPIAEDPVVTAESSPESKKGGKRLTKKSGQGGFKGMFGRKKNQPPERPAPPTPASGSAVAAARAALENRQRAAQAQPTVAPQQVKLGRRLSGIGKKKSPEIPVTAPTRASPPSLPLMKEEPYGPPVATTAVSPPHYPNHQYTDSQASLSRVDTNENLHAEREFRTFDQGGPLEDQPAFIPEDSPRHSSTFGVSSEQSPEARVLLERAGEHESRDDESEHSNDLTNQISLVQVSWAQKRKHAVELAARQNERQSEEQSHTTDRTDDGETSGDESKPDSSLIYINDRANKPTAIESRVARIKARVAELTGNMQS